MKELTTFISFLSDSLLYISNYSYANWLTVFSDVTYFTHADERFYRDAALSDFTNIDLWAQSISDPSSLYHFQQIPSENFDAYYRSAEISRADGAIRSRMPFKRPLFGGLGPGAHVSPAQAIVRQRFKSAIDRFIPLSDTDRADIYARALAPSLWYYNFFMSEEFGLIKRIYSTTVRFIQENSFPIFFTEAWILERTLLVYPPFIFDFDTTLTAANPVRVQWQTSGLQLDAYIAEGASDLGCYFPLSLIEFY